MEFKAYMDLKKRMVKTGVMGICGIECSDCPMDRNKNKTNMSCLQLEAFYPEKAEEIVKKWANEHPIKTYKDDFFSRFPECNDTAVIPEACRNVLYGIDDQCNGGNCIDCWNEGYKEV